MCRMSFKSGTTALFFAAQQGHNDVVRFLFGFGASTECRTKENKGQVCRFGQLPPPPSDTISGGAGEGYSLLDLGHEKNKQTTTTTTKTRRIYEDGTTALLKAANKGYNDVIEELLKFSPTLGILKNGTSALHAAVLSGNVKTVALLLEAGADPALRNKN